MRALVVLVDDDGPQPALDHAIAMAQASRSRLVLVSAVCPVPILAAMVMCRETLQQQSHAAAGAALRRLSAAVPAEIDVTMRMLEGRPAAVLRQVLRETPGAVAVSCSDQDTVSRWRSPRSAVRRRPAAAA